MVSSPTLWAIVCYTLSNLYRTEVFALPSLETRHTKGVDLIGHASETSSHQTEFLKPAFDTKFKSRRVKVSYPSTSVPPMTIDDGMGGFDELSTYLPCRDCLILSMEADVEYENGTQATPASSFWLHHAVFLKRGEADNFCGPESWGQRFFAVGNEKTPIDMSYQHGKRIGGYHIGSSDEVAASVDLMNMSLEPQQVIFTVTYEFVEHIPDDFVSVEPVWMDIGGCRTSDAPAQPNSSFTLTSPAWSSTFSGKLVFAGGHLHDGGTHLEVLKNGKVVCNTVPEYKTYSSHMGGHSEEHISKISACFDAANTVPHDEWTVKAYYNTSLHEPMARMDGSLEPVMGISIMYIARDVIKSGWHAHGRHCGWLWHRSLILPLVCLTLGVLLAVAWRYQRRNNGQVQLSSERFEWLRDIKMPLLSHDS